MVHLRRRSSLINKIDVITDVIEGSPNPGTFSIVSDDELTFDIKTTDLQGVLLYNSGPNFAMAYHQGSTSATNGGIFFGASIDVDTIPFSGNKNAFYLAVSDGNWHSIKFISGVSASVRMFDYTPSAWFVTAQIRNLELRDSIGDLKFSWP